jgi:hypothetical protein
LEGDDPVFSHKSLLSDQGFLIYVARTYPAMIPYLKGLHLTIERWRDDWDPEGWPDLPAIQLKWKKRSDREILDTFEDHYNLVAALVDLQEGSNANTPPEKVSPVPRLASDVRCMLELFAEEIPAVCCVRGNSYATILYGCGDASGSGFGSALIADGQKDPFSKFDNEIAYRVGVWGSDSDEILSNFRELRYIVESIEDQVEQGQLKNAWLFMFTDNSTAEAAFY